MTTPRFIQIHTLSSYSATLLNRDDSGLAKRLPYGGAMRTRISSQCLKRHWRMADGPHALAAIEGAEDAVRSRELVTRRIRRPLEGRFDAEILDAIEKPFQIAVYGKNADKGKASRQPLMFGEPELRFLADKFAALAEQAADAKEAVSLAEGFCKEKEFQATMKAMREQTVLPAGLTSALFGRMVTSDTEANIDAPVHVAHAFTVHEEESESDYFSVVDDLAEDDTGADHIGETELTSGLFYGYVVIDIPALVSNITGVPVSDWQTADRALAAQVAASLVHLIAETSPGAKRGSTAPYNYASLLLVEAGDCQPRSLAGAFRTPVAPTLDAAQTALIEHLVRFDQNYETNESRRCMSFANAGDLPRAERLSVPAISQWVATVVREASLS
nr:type I-E CRISPR-associated protein Cas7/Cse4/CasC [uncultured Cohaesibacter sp.]